MRGFSLVELLVAVGITSILVASGVPAFRSYQRTVAFEGAVNQVAELFHSARTLAVSPDVAKQTTTVAYGVQGESVVGGVKFVLREMESGSGTTFVDGRVVREYVVPTSVASVTGAAEGLPAILYPIEQRGASTVSAVLTFTDSRGIRRIVTIAAPTGQVSVTRDSQ
ncbi:MAG: pilus assembly FimT family protein [Patescibacteria group bacterium]|jgi:prepilin-type N-terminal cleavage/methylation domain-containing protein